MTDMLDLQSRYSLRLLQAKQGRMDIFSNYSKEVPKEVDIPKKTFFFLFQKALLSVSANIILNCPNNHHHKNILILHIQKPFRVNK